MYIEVNNVFTPSHFACIRHIQMSFIYGQNVLASYLRVGVHCLANFFFFFEKYSILSNSLIVGFVSWEKEKWYILNMSQFQTFISILKVNKKSHNKIRKTKYNTHLTVTLPHTSAFLIGRNKCLLILGLPRLVN